MPRSKEANQQIREEQREKILEGALHVFSRKGMAATMSDVAKAAGVSQGLAYRYFDNKVDLFKKLIEKTIKVSQNFLQPVHNLPGTPGEKLHFLIRKSLESMQKNIEFYRLLAQISEDKPLPKASHDLLQKFEDDYQELLKKLIIEAQITGEAAGDDPDQLVRVILACLEGLLKVPNINQTETKCPEAEIILRILKP